MNSYGWPTPSRQNAILRKKVEKGEISKEDVMELRLIRDSPFYPPINVMVMKNASVDDLRKSLSELMGYHVGIVHVGFFDGDPNIILGWSGDIKNNSRSYDGNQKLTDLGVVNGTILQQVNLPLTKQYIQREDEERKKEMQRQAEAFKKWQEQAKSKGEGFFGTRQEGFYDTREDESEDEEEPFGFGYRGPRFSYYPSSSSSSSSSSSQSPQYAYAAPKSCEEKLRELKITNRKEYKKWTLTVHPDKFPTNLNQKEKNARIAKFKEISVCVAEIETRYGKDWDLENKKGGRRKSKTKRTKRGHKGTRKN